MGDRDARVAWSSTTPHRVEDRRK